MKTKYNQTQIRHIVSRLEKESCRLQATARAVIDELQKEPPPQYVLDYREAYKEEWEALCREFEIRYRGPSKLDEYVLDQWCPKPKRVARWEESRKAAKEAAERASVDSYRARAHFIQSIEDRLILGETDFDIERAIKEMSAL